MFNLINSENLISVSELKVVGHKQQKPDPPFMDI